jgi:hypothetical protein
MIRDTEIVDTAAAEPEGDNLAGHINTSDIDTVRSPRRSMARIGLAVAGATVLACSVLVTVTVVIDDPTPAATTPASDARPRTPDTIEHWANANTPRPRTPDTIEHWANANTPRPRTPDTIEHSA